MTNLTRDELPMPNLEDIKSLKDTDMYQLASFKDPITLMRAEFDFLIAAAEYNDHLEKINYVLKKRNQELTLKNDELELFINSTPELSVVKTLEDELKQAQEKIAELEEAAEKRESVIKEHRQMTLAVTKDNKALQARVEELEEKYGM